MPIWRQCLPQLLGGELTYGFSFLSSACLGKSTVFRSPSLSRIRPAQGHCATLQSSDKVGLSWYSNEIAFHELLQLVRR
jgi:hypothetical protein